MVAEFLYIGLYVMFVVVLGVGLTASVLWLSR